MAQFFFHVRQENTLFEDRRGGEFADVRAAWAWALHEAKAMMLENSLRGSQENHWIEIQDAHGTLVATLPFVRVTSLH